MFHAFNNKQIHYTLNGNGPCVLMLHGFTEDASIWDAYTAALCKQFTVLTPDLPGHGQSEHWDEPHTMEKQAIMLKELLDIHTISTVVIIGHSMGGYITMAFADAFPEYLKGLCLFHSSAMADSPETKNSRDKVINVVRKNKFSFLAHFIPDLFAPDNRKKYETKIQELIDKASIMKPEGIINAIEGMKLRNDRRHVLETLAVPVLFVAGKQDSRVPIDNILQQLSIPAHAEALFLGGVGHMGYIEAQNEILISFNNFLNKNYSK